MNECLQPFSNFPMTAPEPDSYVRGTQAPVLVRISPWADGRPVCLYTSPNFDS